MRKLVLIAEDLFVRNFLDTDSFRLIEDSDTFWAASEIVTRRDEVTGRPNFAGIVDDPPERTRGYYRIRMVLSAAMRDRSRTMHSRVERLRPLERAQTRLLAHPRVRDRFLARRLESMGPNPAVERLLDEVDPDVVIAPTAGTDSLVYDSLLACRRRGIPILLLVNAWDNMSSKFTFTEQPDWLAVWGEHSVRHAVEIHDFPRERVYKVGSPAFAPHFTFDPATSSSPYPFPYVLFAGASLPFDELTVLRELDKQVPSLGIEGLKVVYRPHPHRHYRECEDVLREEEFEHTVLDDQVREPYLEAASRGVREFPMPALDWYPALMHHAEALVCPLSTMMVEAAVHGTPVIALAFDDGVHKHGLPEFIHFNHFEGIEQVPGFTICQRPGDLAGQVRHWLTHDAPADMREGIRPWLHFDERTYAERLADVVADVERQLEGAVAAPAA